MNLFSIRDYPGFPLGVRGNNYNHGNNRNKTRPNYEKAFAD